MSVQEVDQGAWGCVKMIELLGLYDLFGGLMRLKVVIVLGSSCISYGSHTLSAIECRMVEGKTESHLVRTLSSALHQSFLRLL